jgi:hypothetical protein
MEMIRRRHLNVCHHRRFVHFVMTEVNSSGSHCFSLQNSDLFRRLTAENYKTECVIVFTSFLCIGCVDRLSPQNLTT